MNKTLKYTIKLLDLLEWAEKKGLAIFLNNTSIFVSNYEDKNKWKVEYYKTEDGMTFSYSNKGQNLEDLLKEAKLKVEQYDK